MAEYVNNASLWNLIIGRWRQLVMLAVVAALLSTVFSSPFIIEPRYRSNAVLYPANIIPMGTETPTEQMMQVLESDQIRDSIVKNFDLFNVYRIDHTDDGAKSAMVRKYKSLVSVRKTEYESVVVEVEDTDPLRARDMVNAIIHYFNRKTKLMQKEKSIEVVEILSREVGEKRHEMDSMEAVLTALRTDYGLLDYGLQTEYATERYLDVITTPSKKSSAKEIEPLLAALKEKGGEFVALNEHLWRTRGKYNDLKEQLERARFDVDKQLTYSNIITHPEVADRKSYPIRWLIVLASVIGTLLMAVVVISVIESVRSSVSAK